ncbi:MAG: hypothetical protein GX256_06325 [Fretibacterium sp.]|nr:hypothetical protein [Fretibacterium sp.]
MRVRFDLRPAEFVERERKQRSFNPVRLLAVLLLLFFLLSTGFYVTSAIFETRALRSEIELCLDEVSGLEASQAALLAEIARLKKQEAQFAKTLEIMQSEPPTLEVLNAIETHMDYGMGVNSIRFSQASGTDSVSYTATVDATAVSEEQIISLTNGLGGDALFFSVTMPSSKRDEKTGRVSFALSLVLRPFGQAAP